MRKTFLAKLAILLSAALTALLLTVYRPSPEGLMPFGVGQAEVRAAPGTPANKAQTYNLADLEIVSATLQKIDDTYVDPARINQREMLLGALDYVQRNVAEVMVEPAADKMSVKVQVNDKVATFSLKDVDSPWRLHSRLKDVFRFIQANMNPTSDPREVEYDAANGLLSTLDPHSNLMDPEQAKEMNSQISQKFGGIGVLIGMRKDKTGTDQLTALKILGDDVPAAKAGLKAGDTILKINNQPTEWLTTNEAMYRLRGEPRTKVVVTVARKDVAQPLEVPITRDQIRIKSVPEVRMLDGRVGYLKITNFARDTGREVREGMAKLRKEGARAWVLDLRGNPGGLLQAAVEVADAFVETGTIVATVGEAGKQREEDRATVDATDARTPLVVLVNGGSASASEIVAGALKNLNRAVIVGQTTFGKGSVQQIYTNVDSSELKLTTRQYLTPGDVSIQSVGVSPDVELVPVLVPEKLAKAKDVIDLSGKPRFQREADLDQHLTSKNARVGDKPVESVRYLYERPKRAGQTADDDEDGETADGPEAEEPPEPEDDFVQDFEITFARDLSIAPGATARRSDWLAPAKAFGAKRRVTEDARISAALGKLAIDWSTGPKTAGARLAVTITTDKPQNAVAAGETIAITATVKNVGTQPAYRVRGVAKSDDYNFEDRELVVGKLDPGATKTATVFVKLGAGVLTRTSPIKVEWGEQNGAPVEAHDFKVAITGPKRPVFAYSYQLVDAGNGDGLVQRGESFKLLATIKNVGTGKSLDTQAHLGSKMGDPVTVGRGRFKLKELAPGEERTVEFQFDVAKDIPADELLFDLLVYDAKLGDNVTEKLKFPIRGPSAGPTVATGMVKVGGREAQVRAGASDEADVVGVAKKGAVLKVTGRTATWTRVELAPGRPGFIASKDLGGASGTAAVAAFTPRWQVTPPTLELAAVPADVTGSTVKLSGKAVDDTRVEDVYVLVSNRDAKIDGRKVIYRSNRSGKDKGHFEFAGDVPLWTGTNVVMVVARENDEVKTMQTIYVYRQPDATTAQITPKPKT